ncbi:MAG TPA: GAF domain-containing sensor histidine kinase [Polyangia bacterium]|jgi:signal transduction histidine kinase|nr:GAF domain-containing sensor histidine kinase [Polyangia bacterium]
MQGADEYSTEPPPAAGSAEHEGLDGEGESASLLSLIAGLARSAPLDEALLTSLERVARALVPRLAEGCVIEALEQDRGLLRAVAHRDRATEAAWRKGLGPAREDFGQGGVLRRPLVAQGVTLGLFTLWPGHGHHFSPEELTLAEGLAGHLAVLLENERLRREARAAVELRDSALAMLAHELRTPLQAVAMNIDLGLRRLRASADTVPTAWLIDKFEKGRRAAARLGRLIETSLTLSQLTAERLELQLEVFDVRELVDEVVARAADDLAWAGCECTVVAPCPVVGRWDRMRLDLVLTNLLSNAMKYGLGRPILITVGTDEQEVTLQVRDQGMGIAREDQHRLFQRFGRLPSATVASGLGLGLWLVQQLVQAMQGRVEVASEPGQGATFTITLARPVDVTS